MVQDAFSDPESSKILQEKVKNQKEIHKREFFRFKEINPKVTFSEWKTIAEEINSYSNNNSEIQAIGIYLIALDDLKPDD